MTEPENSPAAGNLPEMTISPATRHGLRQDEAGQFSVEERSYYPPGFNPALAQLSPWVDPWVLHVVYVGGGWQVQRAPGVNDDRPRVLDAAGNWIPVPRAQQGRAGHRTDFVTACATASRLVGTLRVDGRLWCEAPASRWGLGERPAV